MIQIVSVCHEGLQSVHSKDPPRAASCNQARDDLVLVLCAVCVSRNMHVGVGQQGPEFPGPGLGLGLLCCYCKDWLNIIQLLCKAGQEYLHVVIPKFWFFLLYNFVTVV